MSEPTNASYRGLTHLCSDPECHVPGFVATLGQQQGHVQCACEEFRPDAVASFEAGERWCRCDHAEDAHDGHCQGIILAAPVGTPRDG